MLDADVVSNTTKLSLDAYSCGIVWGRLDRVERCTALRICVVVVIGEISSPMIVPASSGIDEAGWIEIANNVGKTELWIVRRRDLTPPFVVDYLASRQLRKTHIVRARGLTQMMMLG